MDIKILDSRSSKELLTLTELGKATTIADVKTQVHLKKRNLYPERQSLRTTAKGKSLKDDCTLESLDLGSSGKLYFKDLGPQVSWTTVFMTEYTGPLVAYLLFYSRPAIIYGAEAASAPRHPVVQIAAACWTFHFAKRLLETIFVHRFSHATMPIFNIFKNSSYYWGFAAFVSYFINHPLYTPPAGGDLQIYSGLAAFLVCELGNLSIHVALRNLRPPGTKERRIPKPTSNPMTFLFSMVSCPNYTYETGAWIAFSVMTQCLPAVLFAVAGFGQMAIWALGKHRNYKKEFSNYPRQRKSILPFLL
ncbi:probable very-long-chain enoyl-CoA reductase art-1 [Acanthaster planci]|uniref:very-long-chain enoyl-CoA reductase n=1 Tax=Acanthaster planci TaxID=133434 RepID=A0A8B7Z7V9_ACAPL|nr:probable very-long-chain enoyl-CoA reductase art-1 [Acanthaster planci]